MNDRAPSAGLPVSITDIFKDEAGLVSALNVLRQAAISNEKKDELRNLFLEYAGENDESKRGGLKNEIEKLIASEKQLGSVFKQPEPPEKRIESTPSSNHYVVGRTRPTPSFGAKPKKVAEEAPQKAAAASGPQEPAEQPVREVKVEVPPAVEPTPTEKPAPPPAAQEPEVTKTEPKAVDTPPPAPKPTETLPEPAPAPAATNIKARIDAIKRDINSKVGNPVNLTEANEAIGRQYMSTLLNAMKQSSVGGGQDELQKLESAYQAALNLIEEKNLGKDAPKATAPQEPEPREAPKPEPAHEAPKVEREAPVVRPEPAPTRPPESTLPKTQSEGLYHRPSDELDEPQKEKSFGITSFASRLFKSDDKKPTEETKAKPAEEKKPETKEEVKEKELESKHEIKQNDDSKLKPLNASVAALPEKMAALKAEGAKREAEAKKPITDLNSPEVEAGLRQLLSEWSLFKKSGFIGTGPSGIDHPLYKKLSKLPMAAVVSGRFEGVTPEIKHQLSDYMTGWRYEQGIMHEMGEPFETYLRRVIKQIIEKQRRQVAEKEKNAGVVT